MPTCFCMSGEKKKNLSEFWRVRGKTAPKAGWGWAFAGRSPKLERKGEKDDRLIYSEWVNQTLMAFGRASGSISALSPSLSPSHTHSILPCVHHPCCLDFHLLGNTFQWLLTKMRSTHPPHPPTSPDRQIRTHPCTARKSRCSSCSVG